MYAALKENKDVYIAPSPDIEVPITKKGPSYSSDFVVFRRMEQKVKQPQSKQEPDVSAGLIVYNKSVPVIIVEAKAGIPIKFINVTSQFYMELFIYCIYIMRTTEANIVLGCLTDGKTWHVFKVTLNDDGELSLHSYLSFASASDQVIINTIPRLLDIL